MSQDYAPALWVPTSHYFSGYQDRKWIIIHGTAGWNGATAEVMARFFVSNNPPTSVHYVVDKAGNVAQCVPEADSAWGNGGVSTGHDPWWSAGLNPNYQTLSIEHVKYASDNSDALTPEQKLASFRLVEHLCDRWGIPRQHANATGGITGHFSIDPVNRSRCPGPYPFDELIAYLTGGTSPMGVPSGWHDDGSALHNPVNGYTVTLGFREYILNHPWDAWNVPLENAHGQNPVEYGNAALGDGTVQTFRAGQMTWTKKNNQVFLTWTGQELLAVKALWEKARSAPADTATVTSLQEQLNAANSRVSTLESQLATAQQKAGHFDIIASAIKTIQSQVS